MSKDRVSKLLKVDVVYLIETIYKRIGIKPHTVNELMAIVKDNPKVWDIYAKGLTMGINQCEKASTTHRLMVYKPTNVSELSAFIAAIRPGFKTMYSRFESRQPFSYGIPKLDAIIQTKEFPYSYILYQEILMAILHFAGFPMDLCYGIIKDIAKKHPEKVRPLKSKFLEGFKTQIADECPAGKTPDEVAAEVWQVIEDSTRYSFNSAHAYSMALDSLYNAYQKAYYPYEFYEVLMQTFSAKGKKDKVAALKVEMKKGFGIEEGEYRWGLDNRDFKADPANHCIYPSLLSVRGFSHKAAQDLYAMSQAKQYESFYQLWQDLSKTRSLNSAKIDSLIRLGYFSAFGKRQKILNFVAAIDALHGRTQFAKDTDSPYIDYIRRNSTTNDKLKTYMAFDYATALEEIWLDLPNEEMALSAIIAAERELLGYVRTTVSTLPLSYCYVLDIAGKFSNKTLTLYQLATGNQYKIKVKGSTLGRDPIQVDDIINAQEERLEGRWSKDSSGNWIQSQTDKELILRRYVHVR